MTGSFRSRWLIEGTLKLEAPLSIRTGEAIERTPPKPGSGDETTVQVSQVHRGGHGWPVIPGSSLKGVLRHWIVERLGDRHKGAIEQVFGHDPRPIAGDPDRKSGRGGKADLHDAVASARDDEPDAWRPLLPLRSSTAIDRHTRTAERRKLFHAEQVAAGIVFKVTVTGDNLDEAEVALLLAAFSGFNEGAEDLAITLGGSAGSGKGRATWCLDEVRCMNAGDVARWLSEPEPVMWQRWIRTDDDCTVEAGDLKTAAADLLGQRQQPAFVRVKLRLNFDGPFLVNDPWRAGEGDGSPQPDADDRGKTAPDMRPRLDHDGRPVLPGESVRGALRSQAERILRTIGRDDGDMPEIDALFGTTGRRGALEVNDFRVEHCNVVPQHFVAIDRFTGGAAPTKLYMAEPATAPVFTGALTLRLSPRSRKPSGEHSEQPEDTPAPPMAPAAIGLMALVLRDVIEGDVQFGWGRAKGYGACGAEIAELKVNGAAACEAVKDLPGIDKADRAAGPIDRDVARVHYGELVQHCIRNMHKRKGGADGTG